MVGLVCMTEKKKLTRLARQRDCDMSAHCCVCRRRGPAPRERAGGVCLVLNIVRRPFGKHQTFRSNQHDNSVVLIQGECARYHALRSAARRHAPADLRYGASDSSSLPCTGPGAPRLNPGRQARDAVQKPFRFAQTRSMQTATAAGEQSDVEAWLAQNIGRWPNLPTTSPRRHLPRRHGPQGCGPATELHPPEAFCN